MKTPEQWADESWHDTGRPFSLFIRDVQNDARAGMIEASELESVIELFEHPSTEEDLLIAINKLKALRNEHTS